MFKLISYTTFFVAITISTVSHAQNDKTIRNTYFHYSPPSGKDGLSFDGTLTYYAYNFGGPEFRLVLSDVDITGVTVNGQYYSTDIYESSIEGGYLEDFDDKEIKGTIYFDGLVRFYVGLEKGLLVNMSSQFKNKSITIELSKKTTDAKYLQDGGSAYFSESLGSASFDDGFEKEVKEIGNWSQKWKESARIESITPTSYANIHVSQENKTIGLDVFEALKKQVESSLNSKNIDDQINELEKRVKSGESLSYYRMLTNDFNKISTKELNQQQKDRVTKNKREIDDYVEDANSRIIDDQIEELESFESERDDDYYNGLITEAENLLEEDISDIQRGRIESIIEVLRAELDSDQGSLSDRIDALAKYSLAESSDYFASKKKRALALMEEATTESEKVRLRLLIAEFDDLYKKKLDAELRIKQIENEANSSTKTTRYTPEELARINQQIEYSNKVRQLENAGIPSDLAHKTVQDDYRLDNQVKVAGMVLEGASQLILDALDRKDQRIAERNAQYHSFVRNFKENALAVKEANTSYFEELRESLPMFRGSSKNIEDLKQEILWMIYNLGDNQFAYTTFKKGNWVHTKSSIPPNTYFYKMVMVEQRIIDAYFKGNELIVIFRQSAKEASYDADDMAEIQTFNWQPSKFDLTVELHYDVLEKKEISYKSCSWRNNSVLPGGGNLIDNESFLSQLKGIDPNLYLKPYGPSYQSGGVNWSGSSRLGGMYLLQGTFSSNTGVGSVSSKLKSLQYRMMLAEHEKKLNDPVFLQRFEQSISEDFTYYQQELNSIFSWGKYPVMVKNIGYTNNPNETNLFFFWEDKYLRFSLPGPEAYKKIMSAEKSQGTNLSGVKAVPKNSNTSFYRSPTLSNVFFPVYSGSELLLTGTQSQQIQEKLYYYLVSGKLYKDLRMPLDLGDELWGIYVEAGKIRKYVEMDYIQDGELKENLIKKGFENPNLYSYRENPDGINYTFFPQKTIMMQPMDLVDFSFDAKVKGKLENNGQRLNQEFLHYNTTGSKRTISYWVYQNEGYEVQLTDFLNYAPLSELPPAFLNKTFFDANYNYFVNKTGSKGGYDKNLDGKGTLEFTKKYYLDVFNSIDFSEEAIKLNGKQATYYDNGNIKSLGITVDGKKVGQWDFYDRAGKLYERTNFNQWGDKSVVRKYKNGILIEVSQYIIGLYDRYIFYPDKGELHVLTYSDGELLYKLVYKSSYLKYSDGGSEVYPDTNGLELIKSIEYEDGIPISND